MESTHEERKRKRMETASREHDEGEGEMRVFRAGGKDVEEKGRGREGKEEFVSASVWCINGQ